MKGEKLYYVSEYAEEYFFHGGVGIIDAERVLEKQGFQPIRLPFHFSFSFGAKLSRCWYFLKMIISIDPSSIVVFIHPLHATLNKWMVSMLNRKKVRVICMIGDINGLKDGDHFLLRDEIKFLQRFRYFIAHNKGMIDWINKEMPGKNAEMIEFFDFLSGAIPSARNWNKEIVFAGNLDKSKFLLELKQVPLRFHLYGPGINHEMLAQSNITYHGVFDPHELPGKLEGSFGLVWDGDSAFGIKGSLGTYMKYITHHKLSLYILAGLPVITSCTSGSADLVKKYGIGFCVNSLMEVAGSINELTNEQYYSMIRNMKPLADRIANGNCLSKALEKMISEMA